MVLGNMDKFNGEGLVAFLDILGFSKEIEEKWGNEVDNPLTKILTLKENLPIFPIAKLGDESLKAKATRNYIPRVQTISDSIVVSFGFDPKPVMGDLVLGALASFNTIAIIWRKALEAGFTVRGAVDFGPIYWNVNEVIGPAFIVAYKLEQTVAKTSRVILSSAANRKLAAINQQAKTLWNDMMLGLLMKDIDGYIAINPHRLYEGEADKKHVVDLLIGMRDVATGSSREKYGPILACLTGSATGLNGEELGKY
jgi:hypothetical protein